MTHSVEVEQSGTVGPRGLGRLLTSTGVSMVGQGAVAAAVPLLAASITRDPFGVSLVAATTYAAWMIVGLPAGALVDRWPRRQTMIWADIIRVGLLAVLSVVVAFDRLNLPTLIALVFLIASASCFFDPAAQAAIPALTGRHGPGLARANGRFWTLDVLGRALVGPPLGAALFATAVVIPFTFNAATFLVSALLLVGIRGIDRQIDPQANARVRHAVSEGIKFLAKHAELRLLTLGMATYNFGYNVAFATLVLFAQDRLGLSSTGFGILLAMLAVGGIAGGWLAPRLHGVISAGWTYAACLALQGGAWLIVGTMQTRWVTGGVLVLIGLTSTVVSVVGGTARQALTPDILIGRITAGSRVVGIGAAALGAIVGGTVASAGSLTTPLLGAAGLLIVSSVGFAVRSGSRR